MRKKIRINCARLSSPNSLLSYQANKRNLLGHVESLFCLKENIYLSKKEKKMAGNESKQEREGPSLKKPRRSLIR